MFEYTGTITKIGNVEQISDKFSKRVVVLTDNKGDYPSCIPCEFINDKTSLPDTFSEGEKVTIKFFINGREWNDKFFTSLSAQSIDLVEGKERTPAQPKIQTAAEKKFDENNFDDDDSLPF